MRKLFLFLGTSLLIFVMLGGSGLVLAAGETPPTSFFGGEIPEGATSGEAFLNLIDNIVDWIFVIVLLGGSVDLHHVKTGTGAVRTGDDPKRLSARTCRRADLSNMANDKLRGRRQGHNSAQAFE